MLVKEAHDVAKGFYKSGNKLLGSIKGRKADLRAVQLMAGAELKGFDLSGRVLLPKN